MCGETQCVSYKLSNTRPSDKNCFYNTDTKDVRCENNKIYTNVKTIMPTGLSGRPDPKYVNAIGTYDIASSSPSRATDTMWVCEGPAQCHE